MQNRPIAIALAASALYSGVLVATANAETHYVRVTLVTGQQLTVTVDVPAGTPVDQVSIPGLPAAVSSIVDLGVAEGTPTPTQTAAPTSTPTPAATPTQTSTPSPNTDTSDSSKGKSGSGKKKKTKTKTESKAGDTGNTTASGGDVNKESLSGKVEAATPTPAPAA